MDPLNRQELSQLNALAASSHSSAQRRQAQLILLAAQGLPPADVAARIGLSKRRVYYWVREFRLRRMGIFRSLPPLPEKAYGTSVSQAPPMPIPLGVPAVAATTPYDRAVRAILVFYLEQIQVLQSGIGEVTSLEEIVAFRRTVRAARRVLRNMGEQFDVTELSSIPKELRWLTRSSRPVEECLALIVQAEAYLAMTRGKVTGVEDMSRTWNAECRKTHGELLQLFRGQRYRRFISASQKFIRTENAGIFGKTAARQQLRYVLPGLLWEQYDRVQAMGQGVAAPKRKFLRQLRRQVRNLYHLLAHFQAVLGPAVAQCVQASYALEEHLRVYQDTGLAVNEARAYEQAKRPGGREVEGVAAFIRVKEAEQENLLERLPLVWDLVGSQTFQRNLGLAMAEL